MSKKQRQQQMMYERMMPLVDKWSGHIEAVNEALTEDGGNGMSTDRMVVLAQCLENVQSQISKAEALYETTQPNDVGPFKKFGLELMSAVVPNLIANDLVSVQPMNNRIGEIRYIQYLYGSNKGDVTKGDVYSDAKQFEGGNYKYSSEEVENEHIGDSGSTTYDGNLAWTPVRPATVKIEIGGDVIVDDGDGNLEGTLLAGTGTDAIDYETGDFEFTLSDSATDDIYANYDADFETAPVDAPEVNIKIATSPIVAKTRKLKALYAFDAAFDIQQDYGVEINTELVGQIASMIKHEIDGTITNDILNVASNDISDFSNSVPQGVSRQEHDDAFYNQLVEGGNLIFQKTKRATINWVIMGTGVANVVETMRSFNRSDVSNPVGPHLAGDVNGIPVYKNPYFPSDEYVVGYKGEGLFDSGYVYAPYMPIITTSLIMTEDFTGRRGFATSFGKKVVNSDLYQKGKVTDL